MSNRKLKNRSLAIIFEWCNALSCVGLLIPPIARRRSRIWWIPNWSRCDARRDRCPDSCTPSRTGCVAAVRSLRAVSGRIASRPESLPEWSCGSVLNRSSPAGSGGYDGQSRIDNGRSDLWQGRCNETILRRLLRSRGCDTTSGGIHKSGSSIHASNPLIACNRSLHVFDGRLLGDCADHGSIW